MKEGWTYKKFGEVCSYHKEQGSFQNLPYVGMEHMESCTGKLLGTISSNSVLSSSFKFNKGEILYGRLRPYLKKVYVAEFDGCCSTEVFPINSDSIEPGFIKYWFLSDKITNMVNKTSAGCRMPRGNMNEVKNFLIGFPEDRKEQKRIVKRLDAAFENIDKLKANAEKQLAEAQTLFQKSLAKAMEPKEGWEEFSFGELIKLQSGDYLPSKYMINGKYPVYGGNGIAGYHNQYNRDGGKIVIGRVGALCGNVHYITTPFWLTDNGFEVLLLKNIDIDFKYLSFYLNFLELGKYARQTAQPVISNSSLKDVMLFLPSYTVQQRIVERLDALSENIRKYEEIQRQIISECDALKQALLRKVFE